VFTIALGLYFRLNILLVGGSIMKSTSPLWVALALLALTVIAYVATPPLRRTTPLRVCRHLLAEAGTCSDHLGKISAVGQLQIAVTRKLEVNSRTISRWAATFAPTFLPTTEVGCLLADEHQRTELFAAGDVVSDFDQAVAAGHAGAATTYIHNSLPPNFH
jgi:hypothetical protein